MAVVQQRVALRHGVEVPTLGLGVFRAGEGEGTRRAVRRALEVGYRHIDTAAIYRNEQEVGEAIRVWCEETGNPREAVFVTTKLWKDDMGFAEALEGFQRSQERLGLGVVDLFLLHWPVPEKRLEAWRALEQLFSQGVCRAIGVSNFTIAHLTQLKEHATTLPHVNQVELHPFLPQPELVAWCRTHEIQTAAYSPLTKGRLLQEPSLGQLADRLKKTPAQLLIRWGLEQGHIVLPKSAHHERIAQNAAVYDFALGSEAHALLADLAKQTIRTAWDPTDTP